MSCLVIKRAIMPSTNSAMWRDRYMPETDAVNGICRPHRQLRNLPVYSLAARNALPRTPL
jgi:hypothetical protein